MCCVGIIISVETNHMTCVSVWHDANAKTVQLELCGLKGPMDLLLRPEEESGDTFSGPVNSKAIGPFALESREVKIFEAYSPLSRDRRSFSLPLDSSSSCRQIEQKQRDQHDNYNSWGESAGELDTNKWETQRKDKVRMDDESSGECTFSSSCLLLCVCNRIHSKIHFECNVQVESWQEKEEETMQHHNKVVSIIMRM